MTITDLKNCSRIAPLHPAFATLFDFISRKDLLSMPLGRIEIDGENLFINNINPECVAADDQVLEMHRQYIDVHIMLEGRERIGWKSLSDIVNITKVYDAEADCALSDDTPTSFVDLLPGQMCIVWPEDPHAPVIGSGKIRKAIAKVKL